MFEKGFLSLDGRALGHLNFVPLGGNERERERSQEERENASGRDLKLKRFKNSVRLATTMQFFLFLYHSFDLTATATEEELAPRRG